MKPFMTKLGLVVAGGAIQGYGMGAYLFPNYIPSGGAGGLAVLINYGFHLNMGLSLWIVNLSMLFFGVKVLGKRFALWTILSITITSLSLHYFEQGFSPDRNLLLDLIFGSIFLGAGIGILMRQGVSNGGVGVVALVISAKRNILPGKPLFVVNVFIFLLTALIIDLKIIVLALTSQWISTKVVDQVCQMKFYQSYSLNWRKK